MTPSLPGPSPNINPTPAGDQIYQPVNPTPVRERSQHFDHPLGIQNYPESRSPPRIATPGSIPTTPSIPEAPSSPASPSFITPPSSPVLSPSSPEAVGVQPTSPETPILPRRSTRVSRPPDRFQSNDYRK